MLKLSKHDLRAPMRPKQPPVMLIDAYNIMNSDPELKAYMQGSGNLSFARAELEQRVLRYAQASGTHVVREGGGGAVNHDAVLTITWRACCACPPGP